VTEPIEFAFMFLAPVLYAIHAVMTGLGHVIMNLLGVKLGFGFSAGLFDYVLNFGKATRPLLLLPIGLVYFGSYYLVFRFAIVRLNLATPGREPASELPQPAPSTSDRGRAFVDALGGAENLETVDACTTRLRLVVRDQSRVHEATLRSLGARGFVRPSERALQVVVGPIADQIAGEIRVAIGVAATSELPPAPVSLPASGVALDAGRLLPALGGAENLRGATANASRLCVDLVDAGRISESALRDAGVRSIARVDPNTVHLILGAGAPATLAALKA
jgi:N-acetylglucosamine PTS system EIICBA or EIICB component